mmetsp:Transcript_46563/g.68385  ORF Transcript_46563/g.68385 Transcript_46563/m.68385 type:complete len:84 (+) Transcript_46563:33-284(+)
MTHIQTDIKITYTDRQHTWQGKGRGTVSGEYFDVCATVSQRLLTRGQQPGQQLPLSSGCDTRNTHTLTGTHVHTHEGKKAKCQ